MPQDNQFFSPSERELLVRSNKKVVLAYVDVFRGGVGQGKTEKGRYPKPSFKEGWKCKVAGRRIRFVHESSTHSSLHKDV